MTLWYNGHSRNGCFYFLDSRGARCCGKAFFGVKHIVVFLPYLRFLYLKAKLSPDPGFLRDGFKVVVIFRELSAYMLACFRETARKSGNELTVFCLPVNSEAPFDFGEQPGLRIVNRQYLSKNELLDAISSCRPDLVYVADWSSFGLMYLAWQLRHKYTLVTGFDNQWLGTPRQRLLCLGARQIFPQVFKGVFIPGEPQRGFARKLGFRPDQIREGMYSADTLMFDAFRAQSFQAKKTSFPRAFLCVARYIPAKGLETLWRAFSEAVEETGSDWQLICTGTGELWESRMQHPSIRHLGFVQPTDMGAVIREAGVFVLPSLFEPWGVVVHEYARAGFPLVLSREVGAATQFLEEGVNGYSFPAGDVQALKSALIRVMNCDDKTLISMAEASRLKSLELSPEFWATQLLSFCEKKTSE